MNWFNQNNLDTITYFNKYWKPYLTNSEICSSAIGCGYDTDQPWKYRNNKKFESWAIITSSQNKFKRLLFRFKNKIVFYPLASGGTNFDFYLVIDINGPEGPNLFGKDVFMFSVYDTEGIRPYCGNADNTQVNNNCSLNDIGTCCAEKIKRDGWKIKDDYPW